MAGQDEMHDLVGLGRDTTKDQGTTGNPAFIMMNEKCAKHGLANATTDPDDTAPCSCAEWNDIDYRDEAKVDSLVNHPDHYNTGDFEVIDVIEDWNLTFCLGNAVKYIARAGHKNDRKEDLEKALWYLQRELGGNRK